MAFDGAQLLLMCGKLETRRGNWETLWQEIGDRIDPHHADFTTERFQGEKRTEKVFDTTAAVALNHFAAIRESLSTPRAEQWHGLRASAEELNELPRVKSWFDDLVKLLFTMRERPEANFYNSRHEGYRSKGAYGTSFLWVDDAQTSTTGEQRQNAQDGFLYRSEPLAQMFIATDSNGKVDTLYKKYKLTAHAARTKWAEGTEGGDKLPKIIRETSDPFQEFDFVRCVMPNPDFEIGAFGRRGQRFSSAEVSVTDKVIMQTGGFFEFPCIVGRHSKNTAEDYGRSPVMILLPGIKTLDEMYKTFIRSGHRAVDPMILLTEDGVLGAGGSRAPRVVPGGTVYGGLNDRGQELMKPFMTGMRLDLTEGMMDTERGRINDGMGVSLLEILVQNPGDPPPTATQVLERAQEKGQLIAPEIGREQSEELGPMIFREVKILDRQGFFLPEGALPMPPELIEARGEFEVIYDSPATRFQKRGRGAGVLRTMEIGAPFINANPGLLEQTFKPTVVMRETALNEGVPGDWLNSPEEAEKIRDAQQEAAEQVAAEEALPDQARAAKDGVEAAQGAQQLAG